MSMIHLSLTWMEHDRWLISLLLHCSQQLAAEHFFPGKREKIRNNCEFCIWQLVHPFGDGKLPASIKTVNVPFSLAILRTFPIMPLNLHHEPRIWYSMRHRVDLLCDWLTIHTDSQWYPIVSLSVDLCSLLHLRQAYTELLQEWL